MDRTVRLQGWMIEAFRRVVTGRCQSLEEVTNEWLDQFEVPCLEVIAQLRAYEAVNDNNVITAFEMERLGLNIQLRCIAGSDGIWQQATVLTVECVHRFRMPLEPMGASLAPAGRPDDLVIHD